MKLFIRIFLIPVLIIAISLTGCVRYGPDDGDGEKVIPAALTLLISSATKSNFTPCGCQSGKFGGLPRRGTIFQEVEESVDWPVLLVDTGDVTQGSSAEVQKQKDNYIFQAYRVIDYDFVNIGMNELRLGLDELESIQAEHEIPWTSASIFAPGVFPPLEDFQPEMPIMDPGISEGDPGASSIHTPPETGQSGNPDSQAETGEYESNTENASEPLEPLPQPPLFQPYRIVEPDGAPGFKVGLFSVSLQPANRLNPLQEDFSFEPFEASIRRTVDILRNEEGADLVILVTNTDNYVNVDIDRVFADCDIVIGSNVTVPTSPNATLNPLNPQHNPNLITQPNSQGQNVEGAEPDESDSSQPVLEPLDLPIMVPKGTGRARELRRFDFTLDSEGRIVDYYIEKIDVDDTHVDDPRMAEISRGYDTEILAPDLNRRVQQKYAGSEACGECHPGFLTAWSEHGHFNSYQTIEEDGSLDNNSCTTCHAIGFFEEPRPLTYDLISDPLLNVGCEGCHSDGKTHITAQNNLANMPPEQRETANLNDVMVNDILADTCRHCHTGEWAAGFNFEASMNEARAICQSIEPSYVRPVREPENEIP